MNIIVTVKADALIAKMANAPELVRRALLRTVTALSVDIQRSVKQGKLTGQVLHVRTGTLRRSINREVTERSDGVFAVIGTNVEYAAAHEYGMSVVAVRKNLRKPPHLVTRKMGERVMTGSPYGIKFPERSFLRSTLTEFEPRIRRDIREAVMGVVK